MKSLLTLIFTSLLVCSFYTENNKVRITGAIQNHGENILKITDYIGPLEWEEKVTITDGKFEIDLEVHKPVIKSINYGRTRKDLFLEPAQSLHISIDESNKNNSVKYGGSLAVENSILDSLKTRLNQFDYSYAISQSLDKAVSYVDSFHYELKLYFNKILNGQKTTPSFEVYANAYITYNGGFIKLYLAEDKDELPEAYFNFLAELSLEDEKLIDEPSYRWFLYQYLESETNNSFNKLDSTKQQLPDAFFNEKLKIIETLKNEKIRDYCLANAMRLKLEEHGVVGFDKHYDYFNKKNSNVQYAEQLRRDYDKRNLLTLGKPAPAFKLNDVHGNVVSLSDFRGQFVYLDFWQTLCSRSGREMPHYLKLQSEYANENIAFVSISVNEDENLWKEFVLEKRNVGTSLRTDHIWDSKVYNDYQINGLPSFVLIDKEGNIIDAVAPKPSSNEIRGILDQLLKD